MGNVRTTFTSDDKDVAKALEKMTKALADTQEKLGKLREESKKSAEEAKKEAVARKEAAEAAKKQAAEQMAAITTVSKRAAEANTNYEKQGALISRSTTALKAMVGAYVGSAGLNAAVSFYRKEWEHIIGLQERASQKQQGLAPARAGLIRTLGEAPDTEVKRVISSVTKIAKETRIDEAVIARAAASAISASGTGTPTDVSLDTVRQAARYTQDDPSAIQMIAGSALDLAKVTGSSDPRANIGYLAEVGRMSRIESSQSQATHLAPALIGMTQFGATPQEAAALAGALSVGAGDIHGATSGTAGVRLTERVRKAVPGDGTFGDKLRKLQENPALARAFMAKSGDFEAMTKGPIEALLFNPQSKVAQDFIQMQREAPLGAAAAESFERKIARYELDPARGTFDIGQIGRSGIERILSSDTESGRTGAARGLVREAVANSGNRLNSFERHALELAYERNINTFGQSPQESAANVVSTLASRTERAGTASGNLTEAEKQSIAIWREMVNELRAIKTNQSTASDPNRNIEN